MAYIVGIDLGTTNSEIAVLKEDGTTEVVPVDGERIMPSCVGLDPSGRLIIGRTARNQMAAHPEKTILSIKRKMGENTLVPLGDRSLRPEEVSSLILGKLKTAAETHLGQPVTRAVITVPAYFDEAQRKATRDAGALAGLDVLRIINEPTAAALAYETGHEENQRILVYDLGGGTFDASLVVVENGVVEVKASHGDTRLGGDDFDRLLIDHAARLFRNKYGVDLLADNLRAANRLWAAAEKAKRALSDHPFATLREEFISGNHHLDIEISRDEYEDMIRPLLQKTMQSVHACLKDACFLPRAIDRIILVGGATRTPLVHRMLLDEMGVEPRHELNPDLIVAMGAAIQGGAQGGIRTKAILVDITPYTFGTRAKSDDDGYLSDDVYVPVIKRNSSLPIAKEELFYTSEDNADRIIVEIYQGEARRATDNIFIGSFWITGLSKARAGNPILLNMELDVNGMLKVTAKEKMTGLSKTVTMDTTQTGAPTGREEQRQSFDRLMNETGQMPFSDRQTATEPGEKNDLMMQAKSLRKRAEGILSGLNEEDAQELAGLLEESRQAIAAGDWETLEKLNESLSDMLFYLED